MIRHLEGKHPIKNVIWRNSHAGWHAGPAEIQHCWIPNTRIRATARGPGHMEREHWLSTGWILGGSTRPASARAPDKNPRIWKGGLIQGRNKEITPPLPVQLVQPLLTAARLEYRTMDTMLKIVSPVGGYGINTQFNGSSLEGSLSVCEVFPWFQKFVTNW